MKYFLCLLFVLLLSACGGEPIRGTVQNKWMVPAHIETTTRCNNVRVGQTSVCYPFRHEDSVPDKWYINICNEGSCKDIEVAQQVAESVQAGQYYEFGVK